jgi:gas vesicle protein
MAKSSNFLTGLLAGAVVGAIAGLVLAPKSGKDIRELVGERTGTIRDKAGTYVETMKERLKRGADEENIGNGSEVHSDRGVQG